jgi:hypothetical protein
VSDPLGQGHRFIDACQRLVGRAEQPLGLAAVLEGTDTGIVTTKEQTVRTMLVRVVELASGFTMLAAWCRLAAKQTGCPGAVVRLQAQPAVGPISGQLEQFSGQAAHRGHIYAPGVQLPLPLAVYRHDQLAVIIAPLGQRARPGRTPSANDRNGAILRIRRPPD